MIDTSGSENKNTNNRDINARFADDTIPGPIKDEPSPTSELMQGKDRPSAAIMPITTGLTAI
jgi:hypothetical protein